MKKIILTVVLIFAGWCLSISAQDVKKAESQFTPGWYLGLNGGINWFAAEGNDIITGDDGIFSLSKNMGYLGRLEAGYMFTPVYTVRGFLGYHHFNHFYRNSAISPNRLKVYTGEILSGDILMNLTNLSKGFDPNRKFSFSAFAGLGAAYLNKNDDELPIGGLFRLGLQADYQLSSAVGLNLIAEDNILTDNFNDFGGGLFVDMAPAVSLGLTYRLIEKEQSATPVDDKLPIKDTEPVVTPVVKDSTPVVVPDVKPDKTIVPVIVQPEVTKTEVETAVDYLNEHIYFAINNRTPDTNEYDDEMKVIAKYVQQHPDVQIIVRGYADRGTGNIEVNNLISKQRAVNVANTLIRKYGVPYKNIWVRWYGGAIQPYNKNAKNNRLVIVHTPEVKQLVPARGADQKKNK